MAFFVQPRASRAPEPVEGAAPRKAGRQTSQLPASLGKRRTVSHTSHRRDDGSMDLLVHHGNGRYSRKQHLVLADTKMPSARRRLLCISCWTSEILSCVGRQVEGSRSARSVCASTERETTASGGPHAGTGRNGDAVRPLAFPMRGKRIDAPAASTGPREGASPSPPPELIASRRPRSGGKAAAGGRNGRAFDLPAASTGPREGTSPSPPSELVASRWPRSGGRAAAGGRNGCAFDAPGVTTGPREGASPSTPPERVAGRCGGWRRSPAEPRGRLRERKRRRIPGAERRV